MTDHIGSMYTIAYMKINNNIANYDINWKEGLGSILPEYQEERPSSYKKKKRMHPNIDLSLLRKKS